MLKKFESSEMDIVFERESDMPENWKDNLVMYLDTDGEVKELELPEDTEERGE